MQKAQVKFGQEDREMHTSTLCSIFILLCHSSQPACSVWEPYIISASLLSASLHMVCTDPANKMKHWFMSAARA